MRFKSGLAAACLSISSFVAQPAAAQSDMLLQLRNSSSANRLRVDSAGGLVVEGSMDHGAIPATGAGGRLMWYPYRAAFRAGYVSGAAWDDYSIGDYSIAGGYNATASNTGAVALGHTVEASGIAGVAMGYHSVAGNYGVALGNRATANGQYSTAIGNRVSAVGFPGAILFGDGSSTIDTLKASTDNQFSVRAAGGYRLYSNAALTTGLTMSAGGSTWNVVSNRNRKQDFAAIEGEDLLTRLRSVPVTTWRYREEVDRTVRHIGPMAQDWEAAFRFAHDTTMINTGDLDGVSLAGVKALEERTRQQAAQLQAQTAQIQALTRELAELRAVVLGKGKDQQGTARNTADSGPAR